MMYDTNFNVFLVQRWLLQLDLALAGDRRLDSGAVVLTFMVHGSTHSMQWCEDGEQSVRLAVGIYHFLNNSNLRCHLHAITAFLPDNIEFLRSGNMGTWLPPLCNLCTIF
eukprot:scaffold21003_cov94-Skeletonema_dohrnii-CCMP3373.AAC.1